MKFQKIHDRAAERKGGEEVLKVILGAPPDMAALRAKPDNRLLALMAQRIFSAGFVWRVIENKWPGFEEAFLGFEPAALLFQPDEFWGDLASDKRIVRNASKIKAVRHNADFVDRTSQEHGGFGVFLADWPATDQVGLLTLLGKQGARLGGATGQYFLRFAGWGGFITSRDMVACLRDAGVDIAETPTSKRDLTKIQDTLNGWAAESGLPVSHVSRICAMSIGDNYDADTIMHRGGGGQEE